MMIRVNYNKCLCVCVSLASFASWTIMCLCDLVWRVYRPTKTVRISMSNSIGRLGALDKLNVSYAHHRDDFP